MKRPHDAGGGGAGNRAAADEKQGAGAKRPYDRGGGGGPENAGSTVDCGDFQVHGRCEYKARSGSTCRFAHKGGVWDAGRSGVVVEGPKKKSGDKTGGGGGGHGAGETDE